MLSFFDYIKEHFSYLSIGHNFDGNFDSWILKKNSNNIKLASEENVDPEFFHDSARRILFKGRIDHDKKMISIVNELGDKEEVPVVTFLLKEKFPMYKIWLFGFGLPKEL